MHFFPTQQELEMEMSQKRRVVQPTLPTSQLKRQKPNPEMFDNRSQFNRANALDIRFRNSWNLYCQKWKANANKLRIKAAEQIQEENRLAWEAHTYPSVFNIHQIANKCISKTYSIETLTPVIFFILISFEYIHLPFNRSFKKF